MKPMSAKLASNVRLRVVLLVILLVGIGLLWNQVFVITGIVGSSPNAAISPLPPPPPPEIKPVSTDWVDLEVYLRNHPTWQP